MLAWAQLMGLSLKPWEARLLRYMESAILRRLSDEAERKRNIPEGEVDIRDVSAVSGLFARMKRRQEAAAAAD